MHMNVEPGRIIKGSVQKCWLTVLEHAPIWNCFNFFFVHIKISVDIYGICTTLMR